MAKKEATSFRSWTAGHATKHFTAASTYIEKLSQSADVHDRLHAHAEFVHKHIDMCHERAKALSDVVAAASNLMGACVSVLHWHKHLRNTARNSPGFRQTGEEGTKRHYTPER